MTMKTTTTTSSSPTSSDATECSEAGDGELFPSDEIQEELERLRKSAADPKCSAKLHAVRTREDALKLPKKLRLAWFANLTIKHKELKRVLQHLGELLLPNNGCKIIPLIGMTGIGKSTLMGSAFVELIQEYCGPSALHELPFILVAVPSHGDHKRSWAALYREILLNGKEPLIDSKRSHKHTMKDGQAVVVAVRNRGVDGLRDFIKQVLINRDVRVIIIDEAVHLKKYGDPESTMNALKSMADVHATTKLLLLGSFDLLPMVTGLDQVVRRGSIIHFKRYRIRLTLTADLTEDELAFLSCVKKVQALWPSEKVPPLARNWHKIALACWGSVGALKVLAMRLLILQLDANNGVLTQAMWSKASPPKKAAMKIEEWVVAGEEAIAGWEYGSGYFTEAELAELVAA